MKAGAFFTPGNPAERLVDTEVSYVMNRANLEQYRGYGFRKVEIINLDVNTCDKCKALASCVKVS